jgi:hypothetical protein
MEQESATRVGVTEVKGSYSDALRVIGADAKPIARIS